MNEKRFIVLPNNVVWDNQLDVVVCRCILEGVGDAENVCQRLNEQQATIDEQKIIIEERDAANERLNRFLIEIGLEKEYIKWEFKKRCVE